MVLEKVKRDADERGWIRAREHRFRLALAWGVQFAVCCTDVLQ